MSGRWGEIPETINTECYDELARISTQVLQSRDHLQIERIGPGTNERLKPLSLEPSMNPGGPDQSTSPFYEVMKLLLKNEIEAEKKQQKSDEREESGQRSLDEVVSGELRDTVTLILTYAGFHHATQDVLAILTDLIHSFLVTFFKKLRQQQTDHFDYRSQADLMPALINVLHQMNVPDLEALRQFEQNIFDHYQRVKQSSLPS